MRIQRNVLQSNLVLIFYSTICSLPLDYPYPLCFSSLSPCPVLCIFSFIFYGLQGIQLLSRISCVVLACFSLRLISGMSTLSSSLRDESAKYRRQARQINLMAMWRQYGPIGIIAFFFLFVIYWRFFW